MQILIKPSKLQARVLCILYSCLLINIVLVNCNIVVCVIISVIVLLHANITYKRYIKLSTARSIIAVRTNTDKLWLLKTAKGNIFKAKLQSGYSSEYVLFLNFKRLYTRNNYTMVVTSDSVFLSEFKLFSAKISLID